MTTDTQDLANELEAESVGNRVSNHNARKAAALLRQQEDKLAALQAEVERRGVVLLLAGLYPDCTKEDAKQHFADYEALQAENAMLRQQKEVMRVEIKELESQTDCTDCTDEVMNGLMLEKAHTAMKDQRDAALARLAEMEKRNQINQSARVAVDNLLAQAGYAEDFSARNLLGCRNFDAAAGASPSPHGRVLTVVGVGLEYRPDEHERGEWRNEPGICLEYEDGYRDCFYISELRTAGASPEPSALQAENAKLITALAACRDAFPVPDAGSRLDDWYCSAMADPLEVPEYVKACVGASPVEPSQEQFCYCNDSISLQSVSGGGSAEGLYGSVRLKVGGEFVRYVKQPSQAGELSDADISKLAAPYGNSSIQGFDHIKAYARAIIAAINAKEKS
jgi:hypothetical protein